MITTLEELQLKITGTLPLLMCRGQLADPFDTYTKALAKETSLKTKTEDNHLEISRIKFYGSLYFDDTIGPFLPPDNFFKALQQAAAKKKKAQIIKSSVLVKGIVHGLQDPAAAELKYSGPRTIKELWNNGNSPFVHRCMGKPPGQGKVLVTRAIFPIGWSAQFFLNFDTTYITKDEIVEFATLAGNIIAIGTWRPKFGQFSVEVIK